MKNKFILILIFIFITYSVNSQSKTDSLKVLLEQNAKLDTSKVNLLNKISEEISRNNPDSSIIFAKQALLNSEKLIFNIGKLKSFKNIATAYYYKGLYNLAIEFFKKALPYAKEENDKKELSELYNDIGVTYRNIGFYNKALSYYYMSLKISEEEKDDFNISNSLNNIAIVYKRQGLNDKALKYYQKSLKIAIDINDEYGTLITYNNIGVLHKKLGDYDKATGCYLKALSIAKKIKSKKYIADCYIDIGEIYFQKKCYKTAMDYYSKALEIKEDLGEKKGISKLYNNIALLNLKIANENNKNVRSISKLNKAIIYGKKSYLLAKSIDALPQIKLSSRTLIDAYKSIGKLKKALFYSEVYISISDSLNNIEKDKALAEIGIKYETEKKDIENISLKKENEHQKKKQRNLIVLAIVASLMFIVFIIILQRGNKKQIKISKLLNEKNKALKDSEAHFRFAQYAGGIGTWEWDVLTDEVTWSKITYEIFGLTKTSDKITNEIFFSFVHPDDKQRIIGELADAIKNRITKYRTEYRIIKKGEILWVVDTSRIILDKNGKLIKKIGVIQDITERKQALIIIKENNQKQKILINNIPAHIYFKDTNLKYVLANNSYAKLFNLTVDEIIGKTDNEIANSEISKFYQSLDMKVVDTHIPIIDLKKEHVNIEGKKYWAKTSKMPYFSEDGDVVGVIGIVNDITKQVENEKKIKLQTETLQNAHKDITDSISYAKTIQQALLPNKKIVDKYLKEYFIFYKPKETVSGDFYYLSKKEEYLIFSVADCTGHGVPGGFLTMLGITYLNDIIKRRETDNVGDVLNILRDKVKSTFKLYESGNTNGLDIALCAINTKTNVLQYAGAYNPLWIIRDNELIEYKATRNPIGLYINEVSFKTNFIQLQNNDLIYMFSDGFQDQMGGELNKKFLVKRFRKLLLENHKLPLKEQEIVLNKTLKSWQKHNEQIDDITVMGIKWKI